MCSPNGLIIPVFCLFWDKFKLNLFVLKKLAFLRTPEFYPVFLPGPCILKTKVFGSLVRVKSDWPK